MCGKRFGNQWFWQVGALLVALQVYNHSFRSSVPRLGNRSFSLCFIHSLAFSSEPRFEIGLVAWKTNWNLGGQRILGSRQKQKCIRLLYCCLKRSIFLSSPVSIKMTVFRILYPLNKSCYPVLLCSRDERIDQQTFDIFARSDAL